MSDICGDNRFEIIAKAKDDILKYTNISSNEDEMKVLDNFLFRCWQMGWLDKYDDVQWADKNLKNIWHNVSEEPKCKELLIIYCEDIGGLPIDALIYHGTGDCPWKELVKICSITYWAYAKDILPKGGEK